jgi:diguanylate cyclase (GGDEF)-like protein/PAS domain S-box-containing protein
VDGVSARDPLLAGRFRLIECLKRRDRSETWRGVDEATASDVIVKLVAGDQVSTAVRLRLEHEAKVLLRVALPSRPVAVGADGDLLYLVQSFVAGESLLDRLGRGPLTVAETLRVGIDVLGALAAAHDEGVIHRDVKPANIVVEPGRQSAVLIDFGLARSSWLDPSLRDEPVGTARYLAPEAAGLVDVAVDERADLYSLGVVLFECLAGEPPFGGRTVGEVLRAHASQSPPHVRALRRDVPGALDEVIHRLLAKDPAQRYQSAAAVAGDLQAIADALALGHADPPVAIGVNDRRRALTEPAFVGRDAELAALRAVLSGSRSGVVMVEAESGGGKSRLLEQLALQLDPSLVVLRGQGVDRTASRPFQVLDGVAAGLAAAVADDPELGSVLRSRLGDRLEAAAAALPALGAAFGVEVQDAGPEPHGEARTVGSLCALLDALGSLDRRFAVIIDDAQWADTLSVKLLIEWQRGAKAEPLRTPVVVVVAFRAEDVAASHPLRSLEPVGHVTLPPFSERDVVSFCESMAGALPSAAVAMVVRLAQGSPFMAGAVLRGLVEMGALTHGPDGWEIDATTMAGVQTSRRAALLLTRRLDLLAPEAARLLAAGAVLGKEFPLDEALALIDIDPDAAAAGLKDAQRRRLVWVDEHRGTCAFAHDKLREAVLERLEAADRAALHQRAAERLEATDPSRVFELAYHFDEAGQPDRAFPSAVAAAESARARHAIDVAVRHYRIAERAAGSRDAAAQRQVYEGLGEVLSLGGDYTDARHYLELALTLATTAFDRSSLEGKLGEVAFRCGDHVAARQSVERALRQLGRWVPRSQLGFLAGALWELAVQAGHTIAPGRLGRHSLEGAEDDLLAARLYSRLAYIFWFHAGRLLCAWTHLRGMNLAERYPPTLELAQAWSEHAPVMTMIPLYRRGLAYAEKSYAVRLALGDQWGQGQSLGFQGVILYAATRYRECIERCQQAVELLSRMGDRWEENTALWHIAFCHYRLGDLPRAVEVARQVHASAGAIGDQTARGISLSVWSRASAGRVPAELTAAELALGSDDAHKTCEVRLAEAVRLLHAGEPDAACAMVEDAVALVKAASLRQEYVAPVYPWEATAWRSLAEATPAVAGPRRRRAIRRARRSSRRAHFVARFYRNNLPHALRELGLVAALRGRRRSARRWLEQSAAVAVEQDAAYELAVTREALARLDAAVSGQEGGVAAATAAVAAIEGGARSTDGPLAVVEASLSLADRFASLLAVGRGIAAAPSPAAVYDAVRDGAVTLLRGERCHIIEVGSRNEATESGVSLDQLSHSLISRALLTRGPVVAGSGPSDDLSESMILSDIRSALCAPIECDGEIVACFYVISRQITRLFADDEIQLASFVATLAGAALEHVAGSEARFRSLAQNSSDVITIVDDSGRIAYQSSSLQRVFGYRPGDMIGERLESWLHPEDAGPLLAFLDNALAGERAGTALVECRMAGADGTWRHVETALNDLLDDPGVQGIVLNTRDVSERLTLEAELRHRAWHDVVTGLANRALFTDRVEHAFARNVRGRASFAVLFLDLDDFKSVNDSLGHAAGDGLLRAVGERLSACVRPGDTVARFGGDEFAILIEDADLERATAVGARVLSSLEVPVMVLDEVIDARASIGVAVAADGHDAEDLLAAADAALYVAKARGKRRVEVFEPGMRAAVLARAGLRADMEHATARGELGLVYQPVVDLGSGQVTGFEALLRWNRPGVGLLGPDEFIGLAEESGVIIPMGAWVLGCACRQARAWIDELGRPLSMAVNISARQLQHPGLVEEIRLALQQSGLEAGTLVLEITESATVQDTEAVIARLRELKELGVGLAIDDFGTGYSSLNYLRRFPVDQLKIDRSFVAGLGRNAEDSAIVATVIGLAASFGLQVVAEGVETLEQLETLERLGCDAAQGYNWTQPRSPGELSQWLRGSPAIGPDRRVGIVDDRASIRAALRVALVADGRFEVVGEAEDGSGALRLVDDQRPDIVLLDLQMPGLPAADVLARLRESYPGTAVVILTATDPRDVAMAGAVAVLDKTSDLSAVLDRLAGLPLSA